jgi:hypothetical protein
MLFDTYGPFALATKDNTIPSKQPDLWAEVRQVSKRWYPEKGLETAIGCYVFALRHGANYKPWYVGMTVAQGGFRREILQPHKREHYNSVLAEKNGQPVIFLLPLLTTEWYFSRDRTASVPLIKWVEKMLFGLALARNPDCRNQRDTKNLREVQIYGVFNHRAPGRSSEAVKAVRNMFNT